MKNIFISAIFVLSGCSSIYDNLQMIDKNRCEKIPSPSERQECLTQERNTYDEYQKYLDKK